MNRFFKAFIGFLEGSMLVSSPKSSESIKFYRYFSVKNFGLWKTKGRIQIILINYFVFVELILKIRFGKDFAELFVV